MVEYCAVLILSAAVLGSLLSSGLIGSIRTGATSALEALLGTGPPPAASGPDAQQSPGPDLGTPPPADPGGKGAGGGTSKAPNTGGKGEPGRTIKTGTGDPTNLSGWMSDFYESIAGQAEESGKSAGKAAADEFGDAKKDLWKYTKDKAGGVRDGTVNTWNSWLQDSKDLGEKSALETREVHKKYGGWAATGYSMYAGQRDQWWSAEASPGGFARRGAADLFDKEFWEATERSENGAEPAAVLAYNVLGYANPLDKGKWLKLLGTPNSVKPGRPDPKPDPRADGGKPGATDPSDKGQHDDDRDTEDEPDAPSCPRPKNSFVPGTPVLLADGSTKPIEDIEVGDEVHAFDPRAGEEGPRPVTDLIQGTGKKTLVDITVINDDGTKGNVTATDEHPFWVPDRAEWVDAIDLQSDARIRTSQGTWAEITEVETRVGLAQRVHNITVDELHTYYVGKGGATLLTHNASPKKLPPGCGLTADPSTAPFTSKSIITTTKYEGDKSFRLDVENNGPGVPGRANIHIQLKGKGNDQKKDKFFYNPKEKTWTSEDGRKPPKKVLKMIKQKHINSALRKLGLEEE
ncbi:intein [Murinocardiopsis flavida]|uniref:Intein n=2 Tax=Murinocardiopsis flavida TaxID=645275 RepID=A0A2P8CQX1_9ACTN|nr:intein [Murinocardiopsis flavida]